MTTHALTEAPPTSEPGRTGRRVLLKLSGEVFGGGRVGVDPDVVRAIARQIAAAVRDGIQVAVVVGGGNFFRGAELQQKGMDRSRADYMGMLGTVMNCLALQDFLEKEGVDTRVQTAIAMGQVAEPYIPRRAIRHLEKGRVVIFGAGAGMPYFSTDTVAPSGPWSASAMWCSCPRTASTGSTTPTRAPTPARASSTGSPSTEALRSDLRVVDAAAFSLCMDNKLPMVVFGMEGDGNITRALRGEPIGTLVSAGLSTGPSLFDTLDPTRRLTRAADRRRATPMIDETLFEAEEKMEKAVEVAKEDFAGIRTGRAHPGMFQKLLVDYYGAPTPLQQLASFQNPEARTIIISPFDKGSMHAIEKAIQQAGPRGQPEQRRHHHPVRPAAAHRGASPRVRQDGAHQGRGGQGLGPQHPPARQDLLEKLVKDGEVGEDEGARAEKELETVTKKHVDQIDDLLKHKEAELLEV